MQKTAYEMRISDWSSDVCSSDLIPMTRSGKQPLQELHTLWALFRLFRALRPALVHLVTIKPVLYGGIAARLARVPAMVSAISGLGFVFVARGAKAAVVRRVVAVR